MKSIIFITAFASMIGCNSDEKKSTDDSKTKNEVGVPNVNGNIPDTTNAIDLSTHKKDTVQKKDSTK